MKSAQRLMTLLVFFFLAAGCNSHRPQIASDPNINTTQENYAKTYEDMVVGFAQIGAESEWRSANTNDIKEVAERLGVELKFSDAQQKQDNQLLAVRKFIAEKVDVIGISPVVETGWTEVFQQAKDAGIPIILVDRRADVTSDLYVTLLGSDFLEEGRNAAREMIKLTDGVANIVELQGTPGSAPAVDRYWGFREIIHDYPGMKILDSRDGDFTRARGREAMAAFLLEYGNTITALYAHNDDMAIGAIQAIEDYGLKPGVDIKIVSVDAAKVALQAIIEGKINVSVECNPLLGQQFFDLALKVVNGIPVEKRVPSIETIFDISNAADFIDQRKY
jgi:ABC-type sugar transport system substrate-binding protein